MAFRCRQLITLVCVAGLAAYAPTTQAASCVKGYRTKDYSQVLVVNRCRHPIYVSIIERNAATMEKQCAIFHLPQKDYGRAYPWEDFLVAEPARSSMSEREAMLRCTTSGYPIVNDSQGNFVLIVRD